MNYSDARIGLSNIEEFGSKTLFKLMEHYKKEDEIWNLNHKQIDSISFLSERKKEIFKKFRDNTDILKIREKADLEKINIISYYDKEYPLKLKDIADPPFYLFCKGKLPDDSVPSVSIIGARMCSSYGKEAANYFSKALSDKGVQIISGMAYGVDGIAGRAAACNFGKSYAVLGSGVDICYPYSNIDLYMKLQENGGILSENPIGSKALKHHFPLRNRIISGLSDIVFVIEAKEKSGTAITVNMALEQGRDVFALPGRYCDDLSLGCNKLIFEGAGVAYTPEVILEELVRKGYLKEKSNKDNISLKRDAQDLVENNYEDDNVFELEKNILKIIKNNEYSYDEIFSCLKNKNNIDNSLLSASLMSLELKGYIAKEMGIYHCIYI